jgi:hypothetical protein
MSAPGGRTVRYRDKDRANLRRSNLYLTPGFAYDRVAADMRRRQRALDGDGR